MKDTIYGLSNEDYHNSPPYSDFLSSSDLKLYLRSPKHYKYIQDHPQPQTDAQRFGSLFHDLMAHFAEVKGEITPSLVQEVIDYNTVVFVPPVNARTGNPYGVGTQAFNKALEEYKEKYLTATILSFQEQELLRGMLQSILFDCGSTSEQVRKLLKWGKPEVSHFIEYEGCKFKWRPDLETKRKIIDWKTVVTDDLSERSLNNIIARYGYDLSAAHYLFFEHERTGVWKTFYWLFVSKNPPYDAVLADASEWTYKYDPETDIVSPQVGAIKFKRLLDLHIKCEKENHYPGAEINIPEDGFGKRIMLPTPPPWEVNNASDILFNQ